MLNSEGFKWFMLIVGGLIWVVCAIHIDVTTTIIKDFISKFKKNKE